METKMASEGNIGSAEWVAAAESDEEFESRLKTHLAAKRLEFERHVERAKAADEASAYKEVR